jgi:hypothetical protein
MFLFSSSELKDWSGRGMLLIQERERRDASPSQRKTKTCYEKLRLETHLVALKGKAKK